MSDERSGSASDVTQHEFVGGQRLFGRYTLVKILGRGGMGIGLLPIAKDSYWGPHLVATLAMVYAWTGERDCALEQLEIVAKIPAGPSYGDLRFNPCWDSLRGDKRFDKIIAEAAKPIKLE